MNRRYRRKLSNFKKKINRIFQPISDGFIKALFSEDYDYNIIFNHYNFIWVQYCRWFNKYKAEFYTIDEYWFYNHYKPLI